MNRREYFRASLFAASVAGETAGASSNQCRTTTIIEPGDTDAIDDVLERAVAPGGPSTILLKEGVYPLRRPWKLPFDVVVVGQGRVTLKCVGENSVGVRVVRPLGLTDGNPTESFGRSSYGSLVNLTFDGKPDCVGIELGQVGGPPQNGGAGYSVEGCRFFNLKCGIRYRQNIWLVSVQDSFFNRNNVDIQVTSAENAGENLQFYNCVFGNSRSYSILLSGQTPGIGLSFHSCSFDYSKGVLLFDGERQSAGFFGCWFELDSHTPWFQSTTSQENSVTLFGGTVVDAANGRSDDVRLFSYGSPIRAAVQDIRFVDLHGEDSYSLWRTVTLRPGERQRSLPFLVGKYSLTTPRVVPLSNPGTNWWIHFLPDNSAQIELESGPIRPLVFRVIG